MHFVKYMFPGPISLESLMPGGLGRRIIRTSPQVIPKAFPFFLSPLGACFQSGAPVSLTSAKTLSRLPLYLVQSLPRATIKCTNLVWLAVHFCCGYLLFVASDTGFLFMELTYEKDS